jgi:hypothetical protein
MRMLRRFSSNFTGSYLIQFLAVGANPVRNGIWRLRHGYRIGKTYLRCASYRSLGNRNFTMPVETRTSVGAVTDPHAGARPALAFA